MRKIFLTLILLTQAAGLELFAQRFTDHLQQKKAGQGSVVLIQDLRLTDILNGVQTVTDKTDEEPTEEAGVQTGRKKKVRGYRIQMYWGNSQRSDQQKANQIGAQVSSTYPELQAYTTFESPHWRCRVGDFATREEAAEYLFKLRRISSDAMIVRSEIFIYQ